MELSDDYYNSISLGYDELYGEEQIQKLDFFLNKLSDLKYKKSSLKILDFGCGSCVAIPYLIDFLSKKSITKIEYVGVDNSKSLIELAKQRLENVIFEIDFSYKLELMDAVEFLNKNKTLNYDIIISLTAIQNFDLENFIEDFLNKINLKKQIILLSILNRSQTIDYIRNFFIDVFEMDSGIKDDYFYNCITDWSQ
ncbi:MAG: class I SAM-dependent methyltransferase [Candidatus Nanoarchaeia archaeon]|nr:class I SAM-dependent methyltransferase [Candidatus Nanoarchaeia archaeon]